ncbi:MAG: hypothetical protein ACJAWV_004232 [Flammeovirgaceae bacterium]|jgi:hypothetical protein
MKGSSLSVKKSWTFQTRLDFNNTIPNQLKPKISLIAYYCTFFIFFGFENWFASLTENCQN